MVEVKGQASEARVIGRVKEFVPQMGIKHVIQYKYMENQLLSP